MFASEDLRAEHEGILHGLHILERMEQAAREKGIADMGDVAGMIHFLRLFADKCHHGKEEDLFFPALERAGIRKEGGPIGQMLLEHSEGRGYIAEMVASAEGHALDANRFAAAARGYVTLLRSHIDKENTILFPAGDRMIPEEEQDELLGEFEEFEETVMGKGTHEKLHKTLEQLGEKYPE